MLKWSDLKFPPINLWSIGKMRKEDDDFEPLMDFEDVGNIERDEFTDKPNYVKQKYKESYTWEDEEDFDSFGEEFNND